MIRQVAFLFTLLFLVPLAGSANPALVQKYCVRCHGEEEVEADIDLRGPYDQLSLLKQREVWVRALEQIEFEDMPPKKPLPSATETDQLISWIEKQVLEVDWQQFHDPGRVSLARITALEYQHSIRDVFGLDLDAGHFLGRDPEGNTGFTNDLESLTFPLFAFDNFMREAERVADLYLSYAQPPWQQTYDLIETWRNSSDGSVELTDDQSAVLLKEKNAPFQLNLEVPFPGIYQLDLEAGVIKGEPIAAMHVMRNGESVEHVVVEGSRPQTYSILLSLSQGANVLSIGYDPDRAPIIQKSFPPRSVPGELEKKILNPKVSKYPFPESLSGNDQAKKAWQRLNNTIQDFTLTKRLADHLLATGQVDYEIHHVTKNPSRQIQRFSPSKVPFNLAAGSVAVFLKIPQAKLEKKIREATGFSHADYSRSVKAYLSAWKEKNPERVRKVPGRITLTRAVLSSHAIPEGGSSPRDQLIAAGESDEKRRSLLRKLGTYAFGRRIKESEFSVLESIYQQTKEDTGSNEEAMRDALVAMLVSPGFLIHFTDPASLTDEQICHRNLAKRLARFLWMSLPDQKLRSLGFRNKLDDPDTLRSAVNRMIDDPRFFETSTQFVEQWLDLEGLDIHENGNAKLEAHKLPPMRREPSLLFHHVFKENRSLLELVAPDYTFLNDSLALHYDIPGVSGRKMRKHPLKDPSRGGLLAMAGILTATSTPERTSPVTRGAFIVELLLGEELPPPPPSVPELNTQGQARTVREELELHREDSACSGCHERIDPFGFVLEHYDQFGAWRDLDKGKPVDASTTLVDGTGVDGLIEFKQYVVTRRKEDFVRNLVERMFEFALGREVQYSDEATIQKILQSLEEDNFRARTLIHEIVQSAAFQSQRDSLSHAPFDPRP